MHGLINRAVQSFVCHTYGEPVWQKVLQASELDLSGFEAMLVYDDAQSLRVLGAVCSELGRPEGGEAMIRNYRDKFQPSPVLPEPRAGRMTSS